MSDLMESALVAQSQAAEHKMLVYKSIINKHIKDYEQLMTLARTDWTQSPEFERITAGLEKMFDGLPPVKLIADILAYYENKIRQICDKEIPQILTELGTTVYQAEDGTSIKVKEHLAIGSPDGLESDEDKESAKQLLYDWFDRNGDGDAIKNTLTLDRGQSIEPLMQYLRANNFSYEHKRGIHHKTLEKLVRTRRNEGEELPPEHLAKITVFNRADITRK